MSDVPPSLSRAPSATRHDGSFRRHARISFSVVGLYGFLILVLVLLGRQTSTSVLPDPLLVLSLVILVFLVRYLSTSYSMDPDRLRAARLFGSRTIRLEEIRRIELVNLRDLSPSSFLGGWGWRGRTWSPSVGTFDSIHTVSEGILVHSGSVPLFISPRGPLEFARELSRRTRSYHDDVVLGPGISGGSPSAGPGQ